VFVEHARAQNHEGEAHDDFVPADHDGSIHGSRSFDDVADDFAPGDPADHQSDRAGCRSAGHDTQRAAAGGVDGPGRDRRPRVRQLQ
jgi:hypothetical protein